MNVDCVKTSSITSSDVSTPKAFGAGLPLNAISRSNWSTESAEVRMVPGSARNWIAVNEIKESSLKKNENKKYDNSTLKKINRVPSHSVHIHVVCAFAASASSSPSTRRRLCRC